MLTVVTAAAIGRSCADGIKADVESSSSSSSSSRGICGAITVAISYSSGTVSVSNLVTTQVQR